MCVEAGTAPHLGMFGLVHSNLSYFRPFFTDTFHGPTSLIPSPHFVHGVPYLGEQGPGGWLGISRIIISTERGKSVLYFPTVTVYPSVYHHWFGGRGGRKRGVLVGEQTGHNRFLSQNIMQFAHSFSK